MQSTTILFKTGVVPFVQSDTVLFRTGVNKVGVPAQTTTIRFLTGISSPLEQIYGGINYGYQDLEKNVWVKVARPDNVNWVRTTVVQIDWSRRSVNND